MTIATVKVQGEVSGMVQVLVHDTGDGDASGGGEKQALNNDTVLTVETTALVHIFPVDTDYFGS